MWRFLAVFVVTLRAVSPEQTHLQGNSDSSNTYINTWLVKIRGGPAVADEIAHRHGFDNLGLVRRLVSIGDITKRFHSLQDLLMCTIFN